MPKKGVPNISRTNQGSEGKQTSPAAAKAAAAKAVQPRKIR
jgi:hypothetical protein